MRNYLINILSTYVQARKESFTRHTLGDIFRKKIPEIIYQQTLIDRDRYLVKGSVGQGNWAIVPWLAIMDNHITKTTQSGFYIVYLFAEDMSAVYLTLAQGVTILRKNLGRRQSDEYMLNVSKRIRNYIDFKDFIANEQLILKETGLGNDYLSSVVAYKKYPVQNLPNDEHLFDDLKKMMEIYSDLSSVHQEIYQSDKNETVSQLSEPVLKLKKISDEFLQKGFTYPEYWLENFYLSLKTKPFVILAGISGTGKTKLVQYFANALGATTENGRYKLIPVRPDWNDPSDLLGYYNLQGEFIEGPLTSVLLQARQPEHRNLPFFVCLDEMNLARVEHYFSDLLSIIETSRWSADRAQIVTDPIFSDRTFMESPLSIPDNVYFVGTVNMDETTHPFSKKVLDRANTIEFQDVELDGWLRVSTDLTHEEAVQMPTISNEFLRSDYLQLVDLQYAPEQNQELLQWATEQLVSLNRSLKKAHLHIGYRSRDLILFYLTYNDRFQLLDDRYAALDLQILQKILPRIQGSGRQLERLLHELIEWAFDGEWKDSASQMKYEFPSYEDYIKTYLKDKRRVSYKLCLDKLLEMLRRVEDDGYTSYWIV